MPGLWRLLRLSRHRLKVLSFLTSLCPTHQPPNHALTIQNQHWAWHLALPPSTEPISWGSFLKSWVLGTHRHGVLKAVVPSDQGEAWHYCISVPPRTGFSVYHTSGETAGFPKRTLASPGGLRKIGLFLKAAEPPCLDGCHEVLRGGGDSGVHCILCAIGWWAFVGSGEGRCST